VVFAYDVVWGVKGRPEWITAARTYPFLNAASEELVSMIAQRREEAAQSADANADADAPAAKPTPAHKKPAHRRKHTAPAD
jgi:membrane protein required for colicin V production